MKKFLSIALAAIGVVVGTVATSGCLFLLLDEPEIPASLID